jgi:hypothetical protein
MIYEPEKLDLKDIKYVHVMECAECTRDLIRFRKARNEDRTQRSSTPSIVVHNRKRQFIGLSVGASIAASLLIGATLVWQLKPKEVINTSASREQVVDLSSVSTPRGAEGDSSAYLMKEVGTFIIELPPLSPAGHYKVMLMNSDQKQMISADGVARDAQGHLELPVKLDLAALSPGNYRLAIKSDQDTAPYFYNVRLR